MSTPVRMTQNAIKARPHVANRHAEQCRDFGPKQATVTLHIPAPLLRRPRVGRDLGQSHNVDVPKILPPQTSDNNTTKTSLLAKLSALPPRTKRERPFAPVEKTKSIQGLDFLRTRSRTSDSIRSDTSTSIQGSGTFNRRVEAALHSQLPTRAERCGLGFLERRSQTSEPTVSSQEVTTSTSAPIDPMYMPSSRDNTLQREQKRLLATIQRLCPDDTRFKHLKLPDDATTSKS